MQYNVLSTMSTDNNQQPGKRVLRLILLCYYTLWLNSNLNYDLFITFVSNQENLTTAYLNCLMVKQQSKLMVK